jgi:hypothetical protein
MDIKIIGIKTLYLFIKALVIYCSFRLPHFFASNRKGENFPATVFEKIKTYIIWFIIIVFIFSAFSIDDYMDTNTVCSYIIVCYSFCVVGLIEGFIKDSKISNQDRWERNK